MNILLISPMLHQGGFERICVMTARLLKEKHKVTIAVFSLEDLAFDIDGLEVVNLNLPAVPGRAAKIINIAKRAIALTKLQKKRKIDCSYSFGTTANIANACSRGKCFKLAACHSFEEIKSLVYMDLIGSLCDKVVCCSEKMTDYVRQKYPRIGAETLWNPCDLERVAKQSKDAVSDLPFADALDDGKGTGDSGQKRRFLVTMGREDDVKGYWHLLRIFAGVEKRHPETRLMIVGDGTFTEYKEQAKHLGVADKVAFTGHKTNPFPYTAAADLFLLTSLSEGLPNVLVESMALGVPVVSVNCMSGPAEILHEDWKRAEMQDGVFRADYGVLTPPLSAHKDLQGTELEPEEEQMVSAICSLLEQEEERNHYCQKGKLGSRRFTPEAYCTRLEVLMKG